MHKEYWDQRRVSKAHKTQRRKQNPNALSSGLPADGREQWLPLLSFLFFSFIMTPVKDHSHVSYPDCRRRLLSELPGLPPVPNLFPPPFRRVCLADILTNNETNMPTTTQNRHIQTHRIPRGALILWARRREKQRAAQHHTTRYNTTQHDTNHIGCRVDSQRSSCPQMHKQTNI